MRFAVFLAVAALASGPAFAADPPAAPAEKPTDVSGVTVTGAAPVAPPKADDPIICRSSPTSGSRVRAERICRKRSEWTANAKARGRGNQDIKMIGCDSGGTNCGVSDRPPGM